MVAIAGSWLCVSSSYKCSPSPVAVLTQQSTNFYNKPILSVTARLRREQLFLGMCMVLLGPTPEGSR